jgi:hypothetical protein
LTLIFPIKKILSQFQQVILSSTFYYQWFCRRAFHGTITVNWRCFPFMISRLSPQKQIQTSYNKHGPKYPAQLTLFDYQNHKKRNHRNSYKLSVTVQNIRSWLQLVTGGISSCSLPWYHAQTSKTKTQIIRQTGQTNRGITE